MKLGFEECGIDTSPEATWRSCRQLNGDFIRCDTCKERFSCWTASELTDFEMWMNENGSLYVSSGGQFFTISSGGIMASSVTTTSGWSL